MELTLKTTYDRRFIKQEWENTPVEDAQFDLRRSIAQRMLDTEDAGVRQALINMGWTPPPPPIPADCDCGSLCKQRGLASDEVDRPCRAVFGVNKDG